MATHQGPTQQFEYLNRYAEKNAADIEKHIKQDICLCYSGMSGTALATALFMQLNLRKKFPYKIGMLFVRKEDEPSNSGNKIHFHDAGENHGEGNSPIYVFVDDQIGGGNTFGRTETGLKNVWSRLGGWYGNPTGQKLAEEKWGKKEITYMCLKDAGLYKLVHRTPEEIKADPYRGFANNALCQTRVLVNCNNPKDNYR